MCGRFASTQTDADLVRAFRVEEVVGEQLAPSYNVAQANRYGQFSNGHRVRSPRPHLFAKSVRSVGV